MALSRAAGLCRLALRTQWAAVRLLSSAGTGGEAPSGEDKRRRADLAALRPEPALRPLSERTLPEPPRKVYSNPKPTYEQVQLNKAIRDCASVELVLVLVAARSALLNCVSVSSALSVTAKLIGKQEPALWLKSDERFRQLMRTALSMMESRTMDAQGFSNTLYACGQLGIAPPPSWLRVYWDASALKLGDFAPQALSNTMYACSQLDITPPADWLQCFWDASVLKLPEFKPQELSNTLYACSQLGVTPPANWLQFFWDASTSNMGEFIPQNLSNTLYACGQLGIMPPDDWLQRFWDASSWKMGEFKPQNLANTLYACSQLGIMPPDDWLPRFWHASALRFGEFDTQAFSNTTYACGQLGIMPPADWLLRFWLASASKLDDFYPQALSNTLYACGQLGIVPPADWLQCYWQASAVALGKFTPQNFSNTLYACGKLGITPPSDWLQAFSRECERALPDMNQQHHANIVLALATLGVWELPLWPGLWERLCLALLRDNAGWNAAKRLDVIQLYQAYMTAAVERPGLLSAPSPELLTAARDYWVEQVRYGLDNETSRLHGDVSACLTQMGIAHVNERWCELAERCVDIAIEGVAPVAVEVDGPTHFLQDGRHNGSTLLRNRMLAAHGWRVVVVDYRIWDGQPTEAQREEYLRSLLA